MDEAYCDGIRTYPIAERRTQRIAYWKKYRDQLEFFSPTL